MNILLIVLITCGLLAIWSVYSFFSGGGAPKPDQAKQGEAEDDDDEESSDAVVSPTPTKVSQWDKAKGWWNRPWGLGKALVVLTALVLIGWTFGGQKEKPEPDTVGSGQPLFHGSEVTVEKHTGGYDYSALPKYAVMANSVTYLETGGHDVYILVWRRNGNELVPASEGPELYNGKVFCWGRFETYSLFLHPKSKVRKVKVTAVVDETRRCNSTGAVVSL